MKNTSMKLNLISGLAVALILIAGCSTPTKVDKGPIKAASFSFLHPGPLPEAAFAANRQRVHAMVQEAISDNLTAKGLKRVPDSGEVTVAYLIIVGNNVTTSAIDDYFGYGPDTRALADKAQTAYTENDQRGYFQAGTLLIDLVDSRTHKLLQRHHVTKPLLQNPTADVRKANIQEAVNEALQGVRIEP
jgi:hypothetical protein